MIRVFRHYVPRTIVILGTSEALILFASIYVGVAVPLTEFNPTSNLLTGHLWTRGLVYAGIMVLVMAGVGLYQRDLRDDLRGLLFRVGVAFLLGLIILSALLSVMPEMTIGNTALTLTFLVSVAGVMIFRAVMYRYAHTGLFRRRVMILGAGQTAAQVERLRRKSDWQDLSLVGYVHVPGEESVIDQSRIISWNGNLYELVRLHDADEIVVAIGDRRRHFPINDILDCKMHGVRITDLVGFFERQTGKINVDALSPSTMIFADGFIQAVLKTTMHRLVDVVLSLALLAVAWPLMVLAAAAIWIESGFSGPILYRQIRVGRDGRHFEILKFRSMTVDAERSGARWAAPGDSRVTRVGAVIRKTRIDELPQIINVLRGDMSFVGPRPERPEFVAELEKAIPFYGLRHRVNPGITGWAQICYPYGASLEDAKEKLEYDLYYIKNYSLFLDLMILIQTAQVIFLGKGAR